MIKLIAVILLACTCVCSAETVTIAKQGTVLVQEFTRKGHNYLVYGVGTARSIEHDPACLMSDIREALIEYKMEAALTQMVEEKAAIEAKTTITKKHAYTILVLLGALVEAMDE